MPNNSYVFPFPKIRNTGQDYITSYDLNPIDNSLSCECDKYIIKRKSRSIDIYKLNVVLNDILIADSNTIKLFYEQVHMSQFFDITVDGNTYDVRFNSLNINYSNLYGRHNIVFSVTGSLIQA